MIAGDAAVTPSGVRRVPADPPLGAFLGSDARGVARVRDFEDWLAGPSVTVGHTYLPGHTWEDVEGPEYILHPWLRWVSGSADRVLVLNVPMLVPNEVAISDETVRQLLAQGAAGAFDQHFRRLGERLVVRGGEDTVIVLGWEMNGETYTSRCGPAPELWIAYWRRIVSVLRSIPGAKMSFDYNPDRGHNVIAWPRCYPGDDVVDVIGMNSYDQEPGETFNDYVRQPYGLAFHARFAAEHHKPMSFPEWGLFRYGDQSQFVSGMADWIRRHDVRYHTVTDYCPHGVWRCAENPLASSRFRDEFGARRG